MKPKRFDIDGYIVKQAENGHVWITSTEDNPDFIRMHCQYYRRINKRTAQELVSSVRFLSEMEGLY